MGKIITLDQGHGLKGQARDWFYNAVDCIATREIADVLLPRMDEQLQRGYAFERAAQGPAFAMTQRGILVDVDDLKETVKGLEKEHSLAIKEIGSMNAITDVWDQLEKETGLCKTSKRKDGKHTWQKGVEDGPDRLCETCGRSRMRVSTFNPNSPDQVKHLLYDLLKVKPERNKDGEIAADKEALERIGRKKPQLEFLTSALLKVKGLAKQLGFLKFKLSPDNRYKSSFNVGVTWTGRWSSNKDAFGQGGNAQNISERHRHVFVADPGYELCYADLKQAESNVVANLAGDEAYIAAHKADTHTFVARLTWPELDWTFDDKEDAAYGKSIIPPWDNKPGHDYRFQAKAVQHGGNLGLTAFGLAIQKRISVQAATDAQKRYFTAFPHIRAWQRDVAGKVARQEPLVSPHGIRIQLFGRPDDPGTVKQGLAFLPQNTVAGIINMAIWRIWREMDLTGELQLLAQVHDAILWQHKIEDRDKVLAKAARLMTIPIFVTDIYGNVRTTTIATEAAVGQNWGHKSPINPHGIHEVPFNVSLL